MSNAPKYVPPHLRGGGGGAQGGPPPAENNYGPPPQDSGFHGGGGRDRGYDRRGGGGYDREYDDRRGGYDRGYDDRRGGYDRRGGRDGGERRYNNRWNNDDHGGYSGGDHRRGGGGHYGGGARTNALGFHGDMTPKDRLERQLFDKPSQTQGINFDKYDQIPVETSGQDVPEPFQEFPKEVLGEALCRNLELCHFYKPTPVQKYSLPIGMAQRDMMACAQTGSGKTAGFLFPVLVSMLRDGSPGIPSDSYSGRRKQYPVSLILAPTRELVCQIYDEAQKFCYCTGIRPVVIYGGADVRSQLQDLERGCDMLVATPGRLVDFIDRGRLSLQNIRFLVLDEADRMLDMGFEPQIRKIVKEEDMSTDRQTFMFSATFPTEIQRLASDFMNDYVFLAVGRVGSASKDVKQDVWFVESQDKPSELMHYISTIEEGLILVFVETKRSADRLEDMLCSEGFPAASIHGDKTQAERERSLHSFKTGRTPVLVATDVAARGLDIPNVTQVINFDLPTNIDDYVHRIGRTGRVGNVGNALSFVNDRNRNIIKELYELLVENEQGVPEWLENMVQHSGGYRGGGGRGDRDRYGGGERFGGGGGGRNSYYGGGGSRSRSGGLSDRYGSGGGYRGGGGRYDDGGF